MTPGDKKEMNGNLLKHCNYYPEATSETIFGTLIA